MDETREDPLTPRTAGIAVLVLTLVGLGLRLWGLGRESLWYDEAVSVRLAGAPLGDLVTGVSRDAGNPDGYWVLLHLWTSAFGRTIESARAMSGVVGAMAVPLVALLCRRIGLAPLVSVIAAGLVAVSPPLVYLGQEARVFAVFGVVGLAFALSTAVALEGRAIGYVGIALAGGLLLHLHYYGFFVLPLPAAIFLVSRRTHPEASLVKLAIAYAVAVAAFVPWLHSFVAQLHLGAARSAETWWLHLIAIPLYSVVGRTLVWKSHLKALVGVEGLIVLGVFAPAIALLVRRRRVPLVPAVFALGIPAIATFVSIVKSPMIHSNYVAVTFPFFLVLLAAGYGEGWRARAGWVLPSGALLAVLTVASLARCYTVTQKTDWRLVAATVRAQGPDLPAYFYEDIGALPFEYYQPGTHTRILPRFGEDGAAWESAGIGRAMAASPDGFWLVLDWMSSAMHDEQPAIVAWLRRSYVVEEVLWLDDVIVLRVRRPR